MSVSNKLGFLYDHLPIQVFNKYFNLKTTAQSRAFLLNPSSQYVDFLQDGTGADVISLQTRGKQIVYGADFGIVDSAVIDQTDKLVEAVNASVGKILELGAGTIMVRAGTDIFFSGAITVFSGAVTVPSNTHIRMSPNTIIKCIPTTFGDGSIFFIYQTDNIIIEGGQLVGDRSAHLGVLREGLHGIAFNGATNVFVKDVKARDWWGDGFYVGAGFLNQPSEGIGLHNCVSSNNRRNNLSVVSVEGFTAVQCRFIGANGVTPQAGVDVEPNAGQTCTDVHFIGCEASENAVYGFIAAPQSSLASYTDVRGLTFSGCSANRNGDTGFTLTGDGTTSIRDATLEGCSARENTNDGYRIGSSKFARIDSCSAMNNGRHGFYVRGEFTDTRLMCTTPANGTNFVYGETITGGTSGATAVVKEWSGSTTRQLLVKTVVGTFVAELVTGATSGATATIAAATAIISAPANFANVFNNCRAIGHSANTGFFVELAAEHNQFTNCFASQNTHGFRVFTSYNEFNACTAVFNLTAGALIGSSPTANTGNRIIGGNYSGNNGIGIQLAFGTGNRIQDVYLRSLGIQGTGILVASTNGFNRVINCDHIGSGRFADVTLTDTTTITGDKNENYTVNVGITAFAGGGQTNAVALTGDINRITTVATAGDSVRLRAAVIRDRQILINDGANSMQVFGAGTDVINGVATATGVAQAAGTTAEYFCAVAGRWNRVLSA